MVEKTIKQQELEIVDLLQDSMEQFANAFSVASSPNVSEANLVKMSLLSHSFGTLRRRRALWSLCLVMLGHARGWTGLP